MNKTLIALAAAGFALAGFAAPAAAAPLAPKQLGFAVQEAGSQAEQVRYDRRRAHRHYRHGHRHAHRHVYPRHFWAPGPWAFRGVPHHRCFPVRGGYVCYL